MNVMPIPPDGLTVRAIQHSVCAFYEMPMIDLISDRRDMTSVHRRHVAIYLSRRLTRNSLPAIARMFGRKDHTTIMNAIERVERLLATDPDAATEVLTIAQTIVAAVRANGLPKSMKGDVDPLQLALDILLVEGRAVSIPALDLQLMARCLVAYARASGDVVVAGGESEAPDEPIEDESAPAPSSASIEPPQIVVRAASFEMLLQRALAVGTAREVLRQNLHTRFERDSREEFERSLDRLIAQAHVLYPKETKSHGK